MSPSSSPPWENHVSVSYSRLSKTSINTIFTNCGTKKVINHRKEQMGRLRDPSGALDCVWPVLRCVFDRFASDRSSFGSISLSYHDDEAVVDKNILV